MNKLRSLVVGILAAGALSSGALAVSHAVHDQAAIRAAGGGTGCSTMGWPLRPCTKL